MLLQDLTADDKTPLSCVGVFKNTFFFYSDNLIPITWRNIWMLHNLGVAVGGVVGVVNINPQLVSLGGFKSIGRLKVTVNPLQVSDNTNLMHFWPANLKILFEHLSLRNRIYYGYICTLYIVPTYTY